MSRFYKFALLALLALSCSNAGLAQAPALAVSYVSGGPFIYQVSGANASPVLNMQGANFESLAIGPDWVDVDPVTSNAAHPFLLIACDTARNQIIRFDPVNGGQDTLYDGGFAGLVPVCGRSSAAGEFFVTNKSGPGVYRFSNVANRPLGTVGALVPTPVQAAFPAGMTGAGITQKNIADLLAVDSAENQVLQAPYASYSTQNPFASKGLGAPVGIARFSNGDVFVSNSNLGSGKNTLPIVAHFASNGNAAGNCGSITAKTNETAGFLASAENDVLYLVTTAKSSSTVWNWNASLGSCALVAQASVPIPVSGIAVPPVPTTTITAALSGVVDPNKTPFFFNSSAFQIEATGGCLATVTAYPISPVTVATMISRSNARLPDGGVPANNLGEGGFSIAYVAKWTGCTSIFDDKSFLVSIYGLFDNNITNNPRILRCDGSADEPLVDGGTLCSPASANDLQLIGDYPLGGIIPNDFGGTTKSTSNSTFVLVNANSGPGAAGAEQGTFCGYQNPLVNTTDPNLAAVFAAGTKNTLSVKFKLASTTGSCQSGSYVTDAVALISVAQLTDGKGNASFHPVDIASTSVGLADQQPLFNTGNQQYQFTLNLANFASGLYSLTTTFLSDNTTSQTIVFKIK